MQDPFAPSEIGYRWSAQDYESVDGLPYVGRLTPAHERRLVATRFRKWGMSNATSAALILTDPITRVPQLVGIFGGVGGWICWSAGCGVSDGFENVGTRLTL